MERPGVVLLHFASLPFGTHAVSNCRNCPLRASFCVFVTYFAKKIMPANDIWPIFPKLNLTPRKAFKSWEGGWRREVLNSPHTSARKSAASM